MADGGPAHDVAAVVRQMACLVRYSVGCCADLKRHQRAGVLSFTSRFPMMGPQAKVCSQAYRCRLALH
jgi:hypothetical protein